MHHKSNRFLSLGHMGLPMAVNLVGAGHEVHGFDVMPAAVDAARAAGIPIAASGADAAVGAENGTLAFMVGGSEEDFVAALPLVEATGGWIVHCGRPELGQAAKVCNNMVLAVSQIAVAGDGAGRDFSGIITDIRDGNV